MRLFLAGICAMLIAIPLTAEPAAVVASASANGVRVRSDPALSGEIVESLTLNEEVVIIGKSNDKATIDGRTAPWYRVLTWSGVLGWAFGGYLKTGTISPGAVFMGPEAELEPTVEDLSLSLSFHEGVLIHVSLDLGNAVEASEWPSVEVLFAEAPGGAPQVVFVRPSGSPQREVMQRSIASIDAIDFVGDARVEICVVFSETSPYVGSSELWVFGQEQRKNRYELLGTLPVSSFDYTKDEFGGNTMSLRSGPEPIVENGQKALKLVRETTTASIVGTKDDGSPDRFTITMVQEETYVLKNGSLTLSGTKMLE
jgi:hypothetical protein